MLSDNDIEDIIDGEFEPDCAKVLQIVSRHGYDYQPDEVNNQIYGLKGSGEPVEVPFTGTMPWLESRGVDWIYWETLADHHSESREWEDGSRDFQNVTATVYIRVSEISEIVELDVPMDYVEEL